MQIAELLKLEEAERRIALDSNANQLRERCRRLDAANYIEEMLLDLLKISRIAGLQKLAKSLDSSREEAHALVTFNKRN